METISFPRSWKARYGFSGAAVLSFLVEHQNGDEWFPVRNVDIQDALLMNQPGIGTARMLLASDGVLSVNKVGTQYVYRINQDRLAEINDVDQEGQE